MRKDIEYLLAVAHDKTMKQILLTFAVLMMAVPATAACFADYKAKRDNPLRLHYGVVEVTGACTVQAARAEIAQRIARDGWQLLNVVSIFGPEGLAERKESAGTYFLRF
ncbi:hypothetical protein THS5294_01232 [Thalassobacter stenotrophicus]|uniref:DUF4177 domain-containing protein n=3 Tax=Thalassobacter stenotrophicus TaxID=266809 RepID=A0A0P1FL65_9RHOB|nr:hypothetical protein THS5294_01232 [Thalassobacter stenotrophicus]SHJ18083.1 hypothetical protein SAMN02744035_02877 [Thalassobacter stenotrophicus DSM 16310]